MTSRTVPTYTSCSPLCPRTALILTAAQARWPSLMADGCLVLGTAFGCGPGIGARRRSSCRPARGGATGTAGPPGDSRGSRRKRRSSRSPRRLDRRRRTPPARNSPVRCGTCRGRRGLRRGPAPSRIVWCRPGIRESRRQVRRASAAGTPARSRRRRRISWTSSSTCRKWFSMMSSMLTSSCRARRPSSYPTARLSSSRVSM